MMSNATKVWGLKVNLHIDSDLVALFITIIVLVNTFKHQLLVETFNNGIFRLVCIAGLCTIVLGMLQNLLLPFINLPSYSIRLVMNFFSIALVATLFLWFMLVFENIHTGHVVVAISRKYIKIFLILFALVALADIPKKGLFSQEFKLITLFILTIIWLGGIYILVFRNYKRLVFLTKQTLIFIPLIFTFSICSFILTLDNTLINTTISMVLLVTYLTILNRRFMIDPHTQTMNRDAFAHKIDQLLSSSQEGSVIVADIVNFKYFNQQFGQRNGDKLLQKIGKFFVSLSSNNPVYRYGKDQFALILKQVEETDLDEILKVIQQRFEAAWEIGAANAKTNVRLAIVQFSKELHNAEEMINAIDMTLAKAKTYGPTEVVYYTAQLNDKYQRQRDVETALRRAIETQTLKVVYQPIFETHSLNIYSAEALARIEDPILGPISPVEFIPIAENTGLIIDLTYEVVRQACQFWKLLGDETGLLKRISINLSAINFLEPRMEEKLLSRIRYYGVSPANIKFELTESTIVHSFERVKKAMDYMVAQKISFSLDDYGKGYSNLDSLINLPFSTVKLDRSIIRDCHKNFIYIESIILMLNRMGKKIVAEGVETEEQLAILTKAGANRVQGFLFARPMEKEVLLKHIQRQKVLK